MKSLLLTTIIATCLWSSTSGQPLTLIGAPDQKLQLRMEACISMIDSFSLHTPDLSGNLSNEIPEKLQSRDHSYFLHLKDLIKDYPTAIEKDLVFVRFNASETGSKQIDSLINYAAKGYEWPTDCRFFSFNERQYRERAKLIPCCNYFRWYRNFKEIEDVIKKMYAKEIISSTKIYSGQTNDSEDYYCTIIGTIPQNSDIIKSLQQFRKQWDTLILHFTTRQQRAGNSLTQNSATFHNLNSVLKLSLESMKDSLKQLVVEGQMKLKGKTDSIIMVERHQKTLKDKIRQTTDSIESNLANIIAYQEQEQYYMNLYTILQKQKDSLYQSRSRILGNISLNDLDNELSPLQQEQLTTINLYIKNTIARIADVRKNRLRYRDLRLQLQLNTIQLQELVINSRQELSESRFTSSTQKQDFFTFQSQYRVTALSLENHLQFVNEISNLYFPESPLLPDMNAIRQAIFQYTTLPPIFPGKFPEYFENIQEHWMRETFTP